MNDGYAGGLRLGYNFNRNWGIEASVDMTNHVTSNKDDGFVNWTLNDLYAGHTLVYTARLNAIYHVVDPKRPLPLAALCGRWCRRSLD